MGMRHEPSKANQWRIKTIGNHSNTQTQALLTALLISRHRLCPGNQAEKQGEKREKRAIDIVCRVDICL